MRKLAILSVEICLALLNFISALSLLREVSRIFNAYIFAFFGDLLKFDLMFSLLGFVGSLLILATLISYFKSREKADMFQKIDSGFLAFLVLFLLVMGYKFIHIDFQTSVQGVNGLYPSFFEAAVAYFSFCLIYAIVLLSLQEILERIRDKRFGSSFYWLRFFKSYLKEKKILSIFMIVLLLGLLAYYPLSLAMWRSLPKIDLYTTVLQKMNDLIGYNQVNETVSVAQTMMLPVSLASNSLFSYGQLILQVDIVISFLVAFILAVLTYLMTFVTQLSLKYEEASQEKLRLERLKTELITNVSHDMKTPLTSIINYVDLLKSANIGDKAARNYVEILDQKSLRLKELLADLLEASKARSGNVTLNMENINLSEFVGQITGELEEDFETRNLILSYQQPSSEVYVKVDVEQFRRVLENIFGNALKYSQANTRVIVKINESAEEMSFQLINTSSAPLEMTGEELTEQFIRDDKARKSEGTGLGLYIAKSLAELMGEKFNVHTNGDQFEVKIDFEL